MGGPLSQAFLYRRINFEQGYPRERAILSSDVNTLVQMAFSGHEGPLEELAIRTQNGGR
jgi:hypothetical protein